MNNIMSKYWLAFLAIILVIGLFSEFRSVEKVDMGTSGRHSLSPLTGTKAPAGAQSRALPQKASRVVRLAAGQRFNNLEELVNNQLAEGFVRTGYFGKHWPATVTEIATDRHKISFARQDGTRHTYSKFHGYDMKMVRLNAGNQETIVVFRSQDKR